MYNRRMFIKQALVVIASVISIFAFVPYLKDVIKGKTKPHIFSWSIWTVMAGIAFFSQVAGGAGSGSLLLGLTTLMCFLIVVLSFKKGTKDIEVVDWVAAAGSVVALVFWLLTKTPKLSVIIITLSDLLATYPTLRKTFKNPHQETGSFYFLNAVKYVLGMLAIEKYSLVTTLYPAYLAIINGVIFLIIHSRRSSKKTVK